MIPNAWAGFDFGLGPDVEMLRKSVGDFAQDRIAPRADAIDRDNTFPRDLWPDLNRVHVDITQGFGNDRLFLRFETYTPNFSHFEVNVDNSGWKEVGGRWTWLLQSGRNTIEARAVNKLGAKGKPSRFVVNHADCGLGISD